MGRYFLDSSALVKRYHHESGSPAVDAVFNTPGNRCFISRLALVEVRSVFARLVREGSISIDDFRRLEVRLHADVADKSLIVAAVTSKRLDEAAVLLATLGLANNIRTLDALHLATAQVLNTRSPFVALIAADKKLLVAAAAMGLATLDVC